MSIKETIMRLLIIYASQEGPTKQIARRIAHQMVDEGMPTDLYNVLEEPADEIAIDSYDAVMLGSPLYDGHFDARIEWCVREYRRFLSEVPTAVFSVSHRMVGVDDDVEDEDICGTDNFETRLHWQPSMKQTFSGVERYSRYTLLKRRLMDWIAESEETDDERDCEAMDWDSVDEFASRFARFIRSCKQPAEKRPGFAGWVSHPKREYSVSSTRR
jgi:menaquinone-dependent protoporphyrinogen oxidase